MFVGLYFFFVGYRGRVSKLVCLLLRVYKLRWQRYLLNFFWGGGGFLLVFFAQKQRIVTTALLQ